MTFGEAFGAATGVSEPRLQKIQTRNNGAGAERRAPWPQNPVSHEPTRKPASFPPSLFRPNDDLYPPVFLLGGHVAGGHEEFGLAPSPRIQARGLESE